MKLYIVGNHTAPYGEFPYDKGHEFEKALIKHWSAIHYFSFNCIDGADIWIHAHKVPDMTAREIYARLRDAVNAASKAVEWEIWEVPTLRDNGP